MFPNQAGASCLACTYTYSLFFLLLRQLLWRTTPEESTHRIISCIQIRTQNERRGYCAKCNTADPVGRWAESRASAQYSSVVYRHRLDQLYVYLVQYPRLPFCVLFYIQLIILWIHPSVKVYVHWRKKIMCQVLKWTQQFIGYYYMYNARVNQ